MGTTDLLNLQMMQLNLKNLSRTQSESSIDGMCVERSVYVCQYIYAQHNTSNVIVCEENSCPIVLRGDGYIVDIKNGRTVFDDPLQQTIFDSYILSKDGIYYVLERLNTTSSRNWGLAIFSYDGGKLMARKIISISRNFSPYPGHVYWSGYECRGDNIADSGKSPFESMAIAICNTSRPLEKYIPFKISSPNAAKDLIHSLRIFIPIYGKKKMGVAEYEFLNRSEPDIGAMRCLKNCDGYQTIGQFRKNGE